MRADEPAQAKPDTRVSPGLSKRPNSFAIMEEHEWVVGTFQFGPIKLHAADGSQFAGHRAGAGVVILRGPRIEENEVVFAAYLCPEQRTGFPLSHPVELANG